MNPSALRLPILHALPDSCRDTDVAVAELLVMRNSEALWIFPSYAKKLCVTSVILLATTGSDGAWKFLIGFSHHYSLEMHPL